MRLKGTITFEYTAEPADYLDHTDEPVESVTIERMAAIDENMLLELTLLHLDLSDTFEVTIEPVTDPKSGV